MKNKLKKALLAIAVTTSPLVVHAENFQPGFYGIANAGTTKINWANGATNQGNGYQIGLGYEFSRYIAVEGSYGSLFKFEETGTLSGSAYSLTYNLTSFNFMGVLRYPTGGSVTPFITGGYIRISEKITASAGSYSASQSGSGTRLAYGLGADFALDNRNAVRAQYTKIGKENGVDGSQFTVGLVVRF